MKYMTDVTNLTLDQQVVWLCTELCGQYPLMSAEYRGRVAAAVTTMRLLCDQEQVKQIDDLLADAIEDARVGRSNAEIDDFIRDAKQARAEAAAKQNADDQAN